MAKWRVSYTIGDVSDCKDFDDEAEADRYFEIMSEAGYEHEADGGSDTTVIKEWVDG